MATTIWVVIVNYHSQHLVIKCIDSFKKFASINLNYVVIDNSEQPDTSELTTIHKDVVTKRPVSNGGFAAGCNLGIQHALAQNAEYILLINPDTFVTEDVITPLIKTLSESEEIGMASPTIYCSEPKDRIWMAGSSCNWWTGGPKHVYSSRLIEQKSAVEVPFVSGCAMMIKKAVFETAGLMDERYFLYFEDADYCERIKAKGWRIVFLPNTSLYHAVSSTTGFQSKNYVYYFSRNRLWFLKRWAPRLAYIYYLLFTIVIKLPGAFVIFALIRRKPSLCKAFFKGFIDAFRKAPRHAQ
ncbi:glycosyltransferase family 2 protein [Alteromonas sp.]|jgi:hypothetical protein|uniref:glycosyltransferase family 2 protein n=1 Tax=Alteromonas sp. TaxID=232 RepID=UPI00257FBC32|nr:glycosyltransferase family 2 protein [Alteromonas sp.]MBR9895062.1 glycosyltransferase family 2 protein [Gammaproteobacteria bacterium]NQY19101.1 glycosyltransferase family 2 protein [Alteromonas sp.]